MADAILVLNAGSSSLKFSAFNAGGNDFPLMLSVYFNLSVSI
jgi:acetate kinase